MDFQRLMILIMMMILQNETTRICKSEQIEQSSKVPADINSKSCLGTLNMLGRYRPHLTSGVYNLYLVIDTECLKLTFFVTEAISTIIIWVNVNVFNDTDRNQVFIYVKKSADAAFMPFGSLVWSCRNILNLTTNYFMNCISSYWKCLANHSGYTVRKVCG